MTNEDVINDMLRKTFPNVIFMRSINEGNKTRAIHFSEEWLNEEYKEPKTGHWIYDNYNWRCSECNETPKTLGYVGTADFMTEHFKFCNHCGARMVEPQESEE